jgi:hypothetical protein
MRGKRRLKIQSLKLQSVLHVAFPLRTTVAKGGCFVTSQTVYWGSRNKKGKRGIRAKWSMMMLRHVCHDLLAFHDMDRTIPHLFLLLLFFLRSLLMAFIDYPFFQKEKVEI